MNAAAVAQSRAPIEEEWRLVSGYPGYEVSSYGRIRNDRIVMRQQACGSRLSYMKVGIVANGARKHLLVHRAVLEAFVGPCPEGAEACHNNGIADDNRVDNLRWDTRKSNHADKRAHCTNLSGSQHPWAKLTDAEVYAIRAYGRFVSQRELASWFGMSQQHVSQIQNRTRRASRGDK